VQRFDLPTKVDLRVHEITELGAAVVPQWNKTRSNDPDAAAFDITRMFVVPKRISPQSFQQLKHASSSKSLGETLCSHFEKGQQILHGFSLWMKSPLPTIDCTDALR